VFEGKTHAACTDLGNDGVRWCATTASYDQDEEWGDCADTCGAGSRIESPGTEAQESCDTARAFCCAYNTKYGMVPGKTWGATPASEMWGFSHNGCDNKMGGSQLSHCPYACDGAVVATPAFAVAAPPTAAPTAATQNGCASSTLTRGMGYVCGCIHELGLSAGAMACREATGNKFWFPEATCLAAETQCACEQMQ